MKNEWFFISSMFVVFMFTLFIAVYSTIHFGSMEYMNLMMVFMVIVMVSFFLVSAVYFFSEKININGLISSLFFIGIIILTLYAFEAPDSTNLTRYCIIYTIIVSGISCYILMIRTPEIRKDIPEIKKPKKQSLNKAISSFDKNVKKSKK